MARFPRVPCDRATVTRSRAAALAFGAAVVGAILVIRWLLAGSDGSDPDASRWGPLAVIADDTGAEGLATGTLRITATCSFLAVSGEEELLLLWHDDQTTWDSTMKEVIFRNHDGGEATLRDGMSVSFGGGDMSAGSDLPNEEWVASMAWVAPPHPSCPMDRRWYINDYVPL